MWHRTPRLGCLRAAAGAPLLVAVFIAGCGGGDGNGRSDRDETAPTVSLDAPAFALFRTATLTATASDNRGVTQVEFLVDGNVIGTDATAPFSATLDTSTLEDGTYEATARATDAAGNSATSTAVTLTVQNDVTLEVALTGDQEFPATGSTASGAATLQVNLLSGAIGGSLTLTGLDATAAHIHDAFAGSSGPVLIGLEPRAGSPNVWDLPADAVLTDEQVERLVSGVLYLNAHSAAFPDGEVRGQLVPGSVLVLFADLTDAEVIDAVRSLGGGRAAVTVDQRTGATVAHVLLRSLDDVIGVQVAQGAAGSVGTTLVALEQDATEAARWSATSGELPAESLDALRQGFVYVDVATGRHANGELRGQLVPPGIEVGFARLDGVQVVPGVASSGVGMGAITVDGAAGTATVHVQVSGVDDASVLDLRRAAGGREGPAVASLAQGGGAGHWSASGVALDASDLGAFGSGSLYLELQSSSHPTGELRGQLVPPGILFIAGELSGAQEVPASGSSGTGTVAVTIDRATRALLLHANTSGVDDATAAHIHTAFAGANGPVAIGLAKDAADASHWSASDVTLTAGQLEAIEHGQAYVNVHTPARPGGELRGQLVSNLVQVEFDTLSGEQESPAVATGATGLAATTVNFRRRTVTTHVHATGVDDATASHIHRAPAGVAGPVLVGLQQDSADAGHWSVTSHVVAPADLVDFLDGLWYVNVHTPAHPDGEIRAQIGAPATTPPVDTTAPTVALGTVAATVSGTVTLTATADDDVGVTNVRFLLNGSTLIGADSSAPYSVSWDSTTVPNGAVALTAEARDAAGNVGTSAAVNVNVANAAAVTLTQLQASIFEPKCSGCHTGGGGGLPSSMNLSSKNATYAALVNQASLQQPALMRVAPGDSNASYLVHKIEGRSSIDGGRMPLGGSSLSTAEIDAVKAWIDAGAQND